MRTIIDDISLLISLVSIAVIVYGTVLAVFQFIKHTITKKDPGIRKIRVDFGGYLLLGLELLIGADIIKTIIEPTYEELIILGGIVVIRTILSVFLNKEIKDLASD